MSHKRRRTSETPTEDIDPAATSEQGGSSAQAGPKPHEKLWFDDGNIVLATDVHLYCVHKSFLANCSSVFKDMFEVTGGDASGVTNINTDLDSVAGMPTVKMVGDSDENVYHLLMTLYNRDYYRTFKPTKLAIILSLLIMTSKYDVASVRSEVIDHLEQFYPSKIALFKISDQCLFLDEDSGDHDDDDDEDFQLLAVALQSNAHTLLPMLYYECAVRPLPDIFDAARKFKFDSDVLETIVVGRERLSKHCYDFALKALEPQVSCAVTSCGKARVELLAEWIDVESDDPPEFPRETIPGGITSIGKEESRKRVCNTCLKNSKARVSTFRGRLWVDLPRIFDLGTWEDLKRD